MLHKAWNSKGEMPYCFPRSSIKFQGHTVQNITDFDPNWAFPDYRPVAAFKSLRFALFLVLIDIVYDWSQVNWQIHCYLHVLIITQCQDSILVPSKLPPQLCNHVPFICQPKHRLKVIYFLVGPCDPSLWVPLITGNGSHQLMFSFIGNFQMPPRDANNY